MAITLRTTDHEGLVNKGGRLTWIELDENFIDLYDSINSIAADLSSNYIPYTGTPEGVFVTGHIVLDNNIGIAWDSGSTYLRGNDAGNVTLAADGTLTLSADGNLTLGTSDTNTIFGSEKVRILSNGDLEIDGDNISANTVLVLDASKNIISSISADYLDATSSIQAQFDGLSSTFGSYMPLAGGTFTGNTTYDNTKGIIWGSGSYIKEDLVGGDYMNIIGVKSIYIDSANGYETNINGETVSISSRDAMSISAAGGLGVSGTVSFSGVVSIGSALNANGGVDVTATVGSDVLNIGTSNAEVINIGRAGGVINMLGTALYEYQANQYVLDKLITLNYNGAVASATGTGFEIEENSVITGYFKTNGTRNGWLMKAPASFEAEFLTSSLLANRSYTLPDANGTIALQSYFTGTSNRITVTAGAIDIAATYVGQTSITTVGALTTGSIGSGFTAIADAYISSAATWNAKESALTFSTGLTRTTNTITNNLLTGLAGGQVMYGGTAANESLTLNGTSHATKTTSFIILGTTEGVKIPSLTATQVPYITTGGLISGMSTVTFNGQRMVVNGSDTGGNLNVLNSATSSAYTMYIQGAGSTLSRVITNGTSAVSIANVGSGLNAAVSEMLSISNDGSGTITAGMGVNMSFGVKGKKRGFIEYVLSTVGAGTEDGQFNFVTLSGGSAVVPLTLSKSDATFAGNVTISSLTSGGVPVISTAGLITYNSGLTFASNVLFVGTKARVYGAQATVNNDVLAGCNYGGTENINIYSVGGSTYKVSVIYYDGTNYNSALEVANVASGTSNLLLMKRGGAVGVGLGAAVNPDASSVFQIDSTTRGFTPPRMTTTQKNAISSPMAGLIVHDTTLGKLCVYTTAWETITSS